MSSDWRERLQASLGETLRLERELGGGAMSRVFVAEDTRLGRRVVVKLLAPELTEAVSAERFAREVRLTARLQHPNILPVLTAEDRAGFAYYITPYVAGESLRHRIRQGPLRTGEAIAILRDVARALAHAHAQGVVHRDIKPENVLLQDGAAAVADFGIAKALDIARTHPAAPDAHGTLTRTGTAIGTPAYMAPEQAVGDPVDHRADLYAWGVLAYELLAGRHPFADKHSAQEIIGAHLGEMPRPLGAVAPSAPPMLAAVVMRCLAKDPQQRPSSATELLATLDGTTTPRTSRWAGLRNTRVAALIAASSVLAAAAVGWIAWRWRQGAVVQAAGGSTVGSSLASDSLMIAVLPFENVGDSATATFTEGLADEVRAKLTAMPGVRVIARSSASQYRNISTSPSEIGRELGVRTVLVGRVLSAKRPNGSLRIRVEPELIELRRNGVPTAKWQQSFDADLSDVFDVQSQIAEQVTSALGVAIGSSEQQTLMARPTSDLDAWAAYVRGRDLWESGGNSAANARRVLAAYEEAVRRDSNFALAWTQIAVLSSDRYARYAQSSADSSMAHRAAERATLLAPDSPEAHLAMGYYVGAVRGDLRGALREAQAGLRHAPGQLDLLDLASLLERELGLWNDAAAHFQLAARLNPRSAALAVNLGDFLLSLHRFAEADSALQHALTLRPTLINAYHARVKVALAQGDRASATAIVRAVPSVVSDTAFTAYMANFDDLMWVLDSARQHLLDTLGPAAFEGDTVTWALALAQMHALNGDSARARALIVRFLSVFDRGVNASRTNFNPWVSRALAFAILGRYDEALRDGRQAAALAGAPGNNASNYVHFQLARIFTASGKRDEAIDELQPLLQRPGHVTPGWIHVDPNFTALRGYPRFDRLASAPPVRF